MGQLNFKPNYYEILQVNHKADPDVIKAAYRSLSKKNHPDYNGDEEKMKLINEAYEILMNPVIREDYDQWLRNNTKQRPRETVYYKATKRKTSKDEFSQQSSEYKANNKPEADQTSKYKSKNKQAEPIKTPISKKISRMLKQGNGSLFGVGILVLSIIMDLFKRSDIFAISGAIGIIIFFIYTRSILLTLALIFILNFALTKIQPMIMLYLK
ncbi:DnaJ domain-containing protein [Bacteroides sp.]|uniref:J domain-containing protein n=1 Tax=Bacteroides sp. TaxID=29523 RepID=UPI0026068C45|nr:DnaJ domain-containing protein [Bacteroides sp.]MDD3040400.1 DnaJ domain-containing protein [Bacteroides sp.]